MTKSTARTFVGLLLGSLALAACTSEKQQASRYRVTGQTVDEGYAPLSAVEVSISGTDIRAVSDAQGKFALTFPAGSPNAMPILAQNATHARTSRILKATQGANDVAMVVLHPYDAVTTLTLPTDPNAPPASVNLTRPAGVVSFNFAAGSLVDASGAPVQGPFEVRAAYWGAADERIAAPSMLYGFEADGSFNQLDTYGMVDFSAWQNGNELQVAPGQTVAIDMPLSEQQNLVLSRPGNSLPNLYAIDPNSGVWSFAAAGSRATDEAAATRTAPPNGLPYKQHAANDALNRRYVVISPGKAVIYVDTSHAWNIDEGITWRNGGCQRGRTVDACTGKVVSNTSFSAYLLTIEAVAGFNFFSGSDGRFCAATPYNSYTDGQIPATSFYITTAPNDASHTAYCNPAAKYPVCFERHTVYKYYESTASFAKDKGKVNWISGCQMKNSALKVDDYSKGYGAVTYGSSCTGSRYDSSLTKPPVMKIYPCTFCSDDPRPDSCTAQITTSKEMLHAANDASCNDLGDIKVPTATCKCDAYGNCKSTEPACKTDHTVGSSCYVDPQEAANKDKYLACCSKSLPLKTLQCGDNVCILSTSLNSGD